MAEKLGGTLASTIAECVQTTANKRRAAERRRLLNATVTVRKTRRLCIGASGGQSSDRGNEQCGGAGQAKFPNKVTTADVAQRLGRCFHIDNEIRLSQLIQRQLKQAFTFNRVHSRRELGYNSLSRSVALLEKLKDMPGSRVEEMHAVLTRVINQH